MAVLNFFNDPALQAFGTLLGFVGSCLLLWVTVRTLTWRKRLAQLDGDEGIKDEIFRGLIEKIRSTGAKKLGKYTLQEGYLLAVGFGLIVLGFLIQFLGTAAEALK